MQMSRKNDMMGKEIRYKSVCGCEKRNMHGLAAESEMLDMTNPLPIRLAAPAKNKIRRNVANTATGISCKNKRKANAQIDQNYPRCLDAQELVFQRKASLSPVRLGCKALSGLWTRWANCGLMPIGDEISISRPPFTLTGS